MGLESGTRISDLVATNPLTSDLRSQGDDHLRLVKSVLKGTVQRAPGMEAETELTLSSGAIEPVSGIHSVDTEADASTDNLDTITATNFQSGMILYLRNESTSRTVVLKHGTGNIQTEDGVDITLLDTEDLLPLRYDGSNWRPMLFHGSSVQGASGILRLGDAAASLRNRCTHTITPTAERILTLPTTSVRLGDIVRVINLASGFKTVINASGGATVAAFQDGTLTLYAKTHTPTFAANWGILEGTGGGHPRCLGYLSATQSLSSGDTKVDFDTTDFDNNSNFSTGTYTVQVAGVYNANINFNGLSMNATLFAKIYVNGIAYVASGSNISGHNFVSYSTDLELSYGDTVEFYAFSSDNSYTLTGGALTVVTVCKFGLQLTGY